MLKNFVLIAFIIAAQSVFAQGNYIHINSADSILAGIAYFENGDYERALKNYKLVHEGDTNYLKARHEEILAYSKLEKFDTAITLLQDFLNLDYAEHNGSYAQLGSAYDALDQSGKAIEVFKMGLKKYPMDANLHFNLAVTYQNNDSLDLAVHHYKKALKSNPFHASSNLYLGLICAAENELAMAMMCFDLFLLIEPASNRSLDVLSEFNEMLKENFQGDAKNVRLKEKGEDNFDDINLIIKNRVALQEKYKTPNKLTLPIVKQNYALVESLKEKTGKGFWYEYYVPFMKEVYNQDKFNDFMYYILLSSTSDFIVKVLEKNSKMINEFPSWAGTTWIDLHDGYTEKEDGKESFVYYLTDNGSIFAKGKAEDNKKIGRWEYFHNNGAKAAEGAFKDDLKNSEWKYYYNTIGISGLEVYELDSIVGEDLSYYRDGSISSLSTYKKGSLEGFSETYNRNGSLSEKTFYTNNLLEGEAKYYYDNGSVHYNVNYLAGELDGDFKEFYDSGELKGSAVFVDGKRNGKTINYYRNGQKKSEIVYIDGKKEGPYANYYYDGVLQEEGQYKADILVGPYKEFHENGNIESEGNNDEDGNENGIYKQYEKNGKLNLTLTFKKGELIAYANYNEAGEIVKSEKKSGGRFFYQNLFFNGNKRAEGNYEVGDGGKHGIWKFYNSNGTMKLEEPYNYGKLNGELKEYFANGVLSYLTTYVEGDREGQYISYFKDGSIDQEGWYSNDQKNDDWYSYHPDGVMSKHRFFVKGKLNGPQRYYDIKGNLHHVDYYNNGQFDAYTKYDTLGNELLNLTFSKDSTLYTLVDIQGKKARTYYLKHHKLEGPSKYFYSNGSLEAEGNYFNASRTGDWVFYFRNGNKSSEGSYLEGNKVGVWTAYYESGSIKRLIEYNDLGQYHGDYISYYDNGKVSYKTKYTNGFNSESFYYSPEGDLQHVRYFENGDIIGYSHEGPDGEILSMIEVKDESAEVVSMYSNGNVSKQFQWENGMKIGPYKEFYKDGTLFEKMDFIDDDYNGFKETYYKNGKIKLRIPYLRDYKHGKEKHYSESGVLLKEINYHYDDKHGYSKYYDESGELLKTEYYYENTIILNE